MITVLAVLCTIMFIAIIVLFIWNLVLKSDMEMIVDINKWLHDDIAKLRDELKERPNIVYECDREECPVCNNSECYHTTNIEHAVNFHKIDGIERGYAENCRHLNMTDVTKDNNI